MIHAQYTENNVENLWLKIPSTAVAILLIFHELLWKNQTSISLHIHQSKHSGIRNRKPHKQLILDWMFKQKKNFLLKFLIEIVLFFFNFSESGEWSWHECDTCMERRNYWQRYCRNNIRRWTWIRSSRFATKLCKSLNSSKNNFTLHSSIFHMNFYRISTMNFFFEWLLLLKPLYLIDCKLFTYHFENVLKYITVSEYCLLLPTPTIKLLYKTKVFIFATSKYVCSICRSKKSWFIFPHCYIMEILFDAIIILCYKTYYTFRSTKHYT